MEYPDLWVFYYDQDTLTRDFENSPFADYLSKAEASMAKLRSVHLSFNEYENEAQKILINQNQLLYSFFSTEALHNNNQYFQYFSSKTVKFVEAEILYETSFWIYGSLSDFLRQRINASLLRTLKFLSALQTTVLQKYNRGIDLSNLSIMDPEQNSLMQNIDSLLVDYQHLNTLIAFFRKAYEGLFKKLQSKSKYYPIETNLVEKIFLFSKSFFTANPRGIWRIINQIVSETVEKDTLMSILRSNEALKAEIYEGSQKKTFQTPAADNDIFQNISEDMLKKILNESTQEQNYSSLGSNSSPRRKRDRGFVRIGSGSNQDLITEYFRRNRDNNSIEKVNETVSQLSLSSEHQTKEEAGTKEEVPSNEDLIIYESTEKSKDKRDVFAILANSPNNPLQVSRFIPVESRMSQLGIQISKCSSSEVKTQTTKKREPSEKDKSSEDNDESDEKSDSLEEIDQNEALDNFFKVNFDDDFLRKMNDQNFEPDKLRVKVNRNNRVRAKPRSVVLQNRVKPKVSKKIAMYTKPLSAWYMFDSTTSKDEEGQEDGPIYQITKKAPSKDEGKKLKETPEHVRRESKEHVPDFVGPFLREDKGPDVPDEQLLGNLLADDYLSEEESNHSANIDNDDQDQDHDHDHDTEHEKSDAKDKEENEEVLLLWDNKRELEHSQNYFVQAILEMKAKHQIMPGYMRKAKDSIVLNVFSTLDKERKHNFWTNIKDTRKKRQIQTEVFTSMEDEDPTYGLNYTLKTLNYFKRLQSRSSTCLLDFECLNE